MGEIKPRGGLNGREIIELTKTRLCEVWSRLAQLNRWDRKGISERLLLELVRAFPGPTSSGGALRAARKELGIPITYTENGVKLWGPWSLPPDEEHKDA